MGFIKHNRERIRYSHSGRVDIVKFISILEMLNRLLLILLGKGVI